MGLKSFLGGAFCTSVLTGCEAETNSKPEQDVWHDSYFSAALESNEIKVSPGAPPPLMWLTYDEGLKDAIRGHMRDHVAQQLEFARAAVSNPAFEGAQCALEKVRSTGWSVSEGAMADMLATLSQENGTLGNEEQQRIVAASVAACTPS